MSDSLNPAASSAPAMIEFRCSQCQKLLRITAAAAGRQAQCPECRASMVVPQPENAANPPVVNPPVANPQAANPPAGKPPAGKPPVALFPSGGTPPLDGAAGPPPMPPASPSFGAPPATDRPPAPFPQPAPLPFLVPAPPSLPPLSRPPQPNQWQPNAAQPTAAQPSAVQPNAAQPNSVQPIAPLPDLPAAASSARMSATKTLFDRITAEIRKIFIGQDELVLGTLVALFSSGHVLIESVPGLGKTLFVRTLGRVLGCRFGRIQFTADLMPSDITGAPIFDMKTQEFRFHPGPVFTQFLLGRRNQSLAGQDPRGPAGDHAGISRDGRADEPQARAAVSRAGHAKPDRERKALTTCPKPSSIASCSRSWPSIRPLQEEAAGAQDAQPASRSRPAAGGRFANGHFAAGDRGHRRKDCS